MSAQAPTFDGGGGPGWGTFSIEMPWRIYLVYGDTRPLAATFPTMIKFLGFLQECDA
jgi:alpha-L-rhamnosidase